MQINRIAPKISQGVSKLGSYINNPNNTNKFAHKVINAVNNFVQGEGYNPGNGAYYTLITAFVLAPRLLQAREPDEFREIATRDIATILTILFAMKGLKSGMCSAAQRSSGLVMVKDAVDKNTGKLKRVLGYLNPMGGVTALGSDDILSRYSNIQTQNSLANMMKTVSKEGGDLAKMFAIETRENSFIRFCKSVIGKKTKRPLYDAAKKMFGEGFEKLSNEELINKVKNITPESRDAADGLLAVVGSHAFDTVSKVGDDVKLDGILNGKANPFTNYARTISSRFETLSLAIVASFLGFGLPKINEQLTMKKHLDKPGGRTNKREAKPENAIFDSHIVLNSLKTNKSLNLFQNFMGKNKQH